jgi:hypothetical protein
VSCSHGARPLDDDDGAVAADARGQSPGWLLLSCKPESEDDGFRSGQTSRRNENEEDCKTEARRKQEARDVDLVLWAEVRA